MKIVVGDVGTPLVVRILDDAVKGRPIDVTAGTVQGVIVRPDGTTSEHTFLAAQTVLGDGTVLSPVDGWARFDPPLGFWDQAGVWSVRVQYSEGSGSWKDAGLRRWRVHPDPVGVSP